ncbi:hypothetical protein G6F68_014431 [Rhizopus microsporus]|nr:hypothetical protein G6F68_014431 [Rhizopus microsporus]
MGLKGPELLRLMSQGVIEFGTATLSYFASDNPINEAIDLAGLAPDVKTARAVTEAFEPVYAKLYGEGSNVKLLGISTYPAQVLFCNAEIKSLADIKGKKRHHGLRRSGPGAAEQGGRLRHHGFAVWLFGQVVRGLHAPGRAAHQLEPAAPRRQPESLGEAGSRGSHLPAGQREDAGRQHLGSGRAPDAGRL